MCSSGGQVATNDAALQASELAANKTYLADYNTSFAEQQTVLAQQKARLDAEVANPMGYTPAQLHSATTSINENTANAAKQAIGAAAAFAAAHGSSDIGGGAIGAEAGRIGSTAALAKAGELSSLSQQNEAIKQEQIQRGLAGLSQVGAEYGGAAGGATTGAGSAATGTTEAGSGVLAAEDAGWSHLAGTLGAISGVAKSVMSPIQFCWVAAAIYGGWDEPRTELIRSYLLGEFSETWSGRMVIAVYRKFGERMAKVSWIVRILTPLFNLALRKAQEK